MICSSKAILVASLLIVALGLILVGCNAGCSLFGNCNRGSDSYSVLVEVEGYSERGYSMSDLAVEYRSNDGGEWSSCVEYQYPEPQEGVWRCYFEPGVNSVRVATMDGQFEAAGEVKKRRIEGAILSLSLTSVE